MIKVLPQIKRHYIMGNTAKIAISIDNDLVKKLDHFVANKTFKNRSQAIQIAVTKTIEHMEHKNLAIECAKLDKESERKMADEALQGGDASWPKY